MPPRSGRETSACTVCAPTSVPRTAVQGGRQPVRTQAARSSSRFPRQPNPESLSQAVREGRYPRDALCIALSRSTLQIRWSRHAEDRALRAQ
eukprot:7387457-Prymnesium_polylepis.1